MTFGPKRGHILYIFDNFFRDFGIIALAIIAGSVRGNLTDSIMDNIFLLIAVCILPFLRIITYLKMTLEVTPRSVIFKEGLFFKKESEIPAASITTIDYSQNLLQQIFKVYKVKIENSSNMSSENDDKKIEMILSLDDIKQIKEILGKADTAVDGANIAPESDEKTGRGRRVRIPAWKILIMGLLESKVIILVEAVGLGIFAAGFLGLEEFAFIRDKISTMTALGIAVAAIVIIAILFVIETIVSVIRFYGFTITDRESSILIEYGLLTKKQYTVIKSRINGFAYEQTLLMRLFHLGTLNVYAVGFGNDKDDENSTSMLHPLLEESMVREFMGEFTDRFSKPCEVKYAAEGSFRYFFYRPVFMTLLIAFTACLIYGFTSHMWWPVAVAGALLLISGAGRIMEYHNTLAGGNEKEFLFVSGGYNREWTYIRTDHAETVSSSGSRWKRKKGIVDIDVDFLGIEGVTSAQVFNVDEAIEKELRALLIY